jgi:hypothetical protein
MIALSTVVLLIAATYFYCLLFSVNNDTVEQLNHGESSNESQPMGAVVSVGGRPVL